MAEAPKPQRRRRRVRRVNFDITSAAPTADATPSGLPTVQGLPRRRRNRRRRRVQRLGNTEIIAPVIGGVGRVPFRRRNLTRAIKRELKNEGLEGPKVSVQQKITSTFGQIGPNSTGNTELELNFFLHPALAKEANDGTAFGPLQALAAQYSLWKIKHLTLRFTPMVGSSAVSGTVIRASLNLSQSPGGSNWSGLGTRLHMDMHPGQVATFRLRGDQVGGPRDGGWWFTDTNEEGSQSAGPIVEVHTIGQTKSTFQNAAWEGPLFLVEGIGVWQFANYQVKPALGTLSRHEGNTQAEITADAGEPITMELPTGSEVAMFMNQLEPENVLAPAAQPAGAPTVGETIFQVVDTGAGLVSSIVPPPFGWLIKGGWWFVKKLLGKTRAAGKTSFVVYASLQDAQNNKPAIATATVNRATSSPVSTKLLITQMNSPNVGPNPSYMPTPRSIEQEMTPGQSFRLHSSMISDLLIDFTNSGAAPNSFVPVSAIPGQVRDSTGNSAQISASTGMAGSFIQTPWWIGKPGTSPNPSTSTPINTLPSTSKGGYLHSLYRLIDPHFTDQSGDIVYRDPTTDHTDVNFCAMNNFNSSGVPSSGTEPYAVYGKVVASNSIVSGATNPIHMVFTLIQITNEYSADSDTVNDLVAIMPGGLKTSQPPKDYLIHFYDMSTPGTPVKILERKLAVGQYLLGVSVTDNVGLVNGVDIPTTINLGMSYTRIDSPISAVFPYDLVGQMFPATSVDITLRYVDYHPPSAELISQLRALNVNFDMPQLPPLEMPHPYDDEQCSSHDDEHGDYSLGSQDEDSSVDSVEEFVLACGNEMIDLPSRWTNNPQLMKMLELE